MFEELNGSFSSLSAEQRQKLNDLLQARNNFFHHMTILNNLTMGVLANPTPAGEEQIRGYASTILGPIRTEMNKLAIDLVQEAVDKEGITKMLPMLLMALSRSVNLPLLMTVFGHDPASINEAANKLSDYFKTGM